MQQEIATLLSENELEAAFNLIVKSYSQRLYWHIRRMVYEHEDADDILQNTFVNAWRALPKFRQDSNVYTWMYRIATNEALSHIRKQKENVRFDDVSFSISQNLEADAFFDGDEIQTKLQQAIATLPEKQRVVFNLRYFDEMPYNQMSEILETSEGGLKANYHHAVKKIEAFLKSD